MANEQMTVCQIDSEALGHLDMRDFATPSVANSTTEALL